jgi:tRNA (cmo5U34)-methyltransferase
MPHEPISTDTSVAEFFDSIIDEYTSKIDRVFPRYREMLSVVLDYLPKDQKYESILELGCGSGNFSLLLAHAFPESSITLVDISGESLDQCRSRFQAEARIPSKDRFTFHEADFRELEFETGSFDLVTSSIAIHHLISNEKQQLFSKIYDWLTPQGIFTMNDQMAGATTDLQQRHMQGWQRVAFDAGSTPEEWDMWMRHQDEHDHHDKLEDHLGWLNDVGFATIDCVWRCLLWTVLQARKQ